MYRRDYLVRMIEQMSEMLGQIMGLKKERKHTEVLQTLNDQWARWFRLNSRLAGSLSEKDLIAMLSQNGEVDPNALQIAAVLLKEEAAALDALGNSDEAYARRMKSLGLLLTASENGAEPEPIDGGYHIGELLNELRAYELPSAVWERLWQHFEREGSFAKAEDMLYQLLEYSGDQEGAEDKSSLVSSGTAFYERLLALDDEALEAGDLPRDEVMDGLERMRAR